MERCLVARGRRISARRYFAGASAGGASDVPLDRAKSPDSILRREPQGHDGRQHGAVVLVPYFQTIEESFHIGIGAVGSHRGFRGVSQADEDVYLIGDVAGLVGVRGESFRAEANRVSS